MSGREEWEFGLEVMRDTTVSVVSASGEIDLATAGQVEDAVAALIGEGMARVVLDLRAVTFMDSTGISMLIDADRRAADAGARLSVRITGPGVRRPLEIAGVLGHLDVVEES